MKLLAFFMAAFSLLSSPLFGASFRPAVINQQPFNQELESVQQQFFEYRELYQQLAGLCSLSGHYHYSKDHFSESLTQIARQALDRPRTSDYDYIFDYDILDAGKLVFGDPTFAQVVKNATGNLIVEYYLRRNGNGNGMADEFQRATDKLAKSLVELAEKHDIRVFLGEHSNPFYRVNYAVLIDPKFNQLLLMEAGYCE